MAMLVLPLAMAIMAILAILAICGFYGHANTNMAIMDIHSKGIEKLTKMCCFHPKKTFQ